MHVPRWIAGCLLRFASERASERTRAAECLFLLLLMAGQFWLYRGLFSETMAFKHDSILWYGMFHYFAESLWAGEWPYWNPYIHGGEPFFYAWNIIRLTDPVTLTAVLAGSLFSPDLYQLYNVTFVARIAVTGIGCYLVLRQLLARSASLASASLLVFWGPLGGQSLAYIGSLDAFSWFPWSLWCLLRALRAARMPDEGHRVGFWVMAASWFLAISVGGSIYHWVYGVFVFAVLLIFLAFFCRQDVSRLFRESGWSLAGGLALIAVMASPLAALFLERSEIFSSARNIHREQLALGPAALLGVDYSKIEKRDPEVGLGNIDDVFRALPAQSKNYGENWFVGHVAGVFLILGLFLGRHRYRWPFIGTLAVITFMYVGPLPPLELLHKAIYLASPPLWLTRHLSIFEPFVHLFTAIFVGLGIDRAAGLMDHVASLSTIGMRSCRARIPMCVLGAAAVAGAVSAFLHAVVLQSNMSHIAGAHQYAALLALGVFLLVFGMVAGLAAWGRQAATVVAAIVVVPAFALQLLEQGLIAAALHRVPSGCNHHLFCEWKDYFENFSFPRRALPALPPPTVRELGMDLKKIYLSYSPTIFKKNVALEDIMLPAAQPVGSETSIHHYFSINFPAGLYHFWLKDYLRLYEIGEWQPKAFLALMGVNRPLLDYRTNSVLSGGDRADALLKRTDGELTAAILAVAAVVDSPSEDQPDPVQLAEVITSARALQQIRTLCRESFDYPASQGLPHGWMLTHPDGSKAPERVPVSGIAPAGQAVRLAPAARGPVLLRFSETDMAAIAGKDIYVEAWVRSDNKTPDAVTVDVQTRPNSGPVKISRYDNSGDWRKLELRAHIDQAARFVLLTLHVATAATAAAEFAHVRIELVQPHGPEGSRAVAEGFRNLADGTFEAKVLSFSPNRLELDVTAGAPGILTYRDIAARHWTSYVDGEPVPLLRADLAFKAVSLTPGRHRVVFQYHPRLFAVALHLYLAGILAGVLYLLGRFGMQFLANNRKGRYAKRNAAPTTP